MPKLAKRTPEEWAAHEQRQADDEARRQRQAIAERLDQFHAAIGRRYESATLETFEATNELQRKCLKRLRKFVGEIKERTADGTNLVLYGPPGTGKDHLLVACLREAVRIGIGVRWINGLTFYGDMRDSMQTENRTEASLINELCRPSILAISDPLPPKVEGRADGSLTDYQAQTMFRVIDRRYRDLKPTWVTMNITDGNDLGARISEPIRDRLKDGAIEIPCNWPSYRRARA